MTTRRPYPAYKDSGIEWLGEVPAHWDMRRLKFTAELIMGQSPKSETYNDVGAGYPFLQGNAEFGRHHPIPSIYCDVARKHVSPGNYLLSVRAPVGAINVADQRYGIGRGLCGIRPSLELDQDFTWYLLEVVRIQLEIVSTGSTYDAVSMDQVADLICLLPPLPEQRAIAAFLDRETARIDALIAKKQRLIELLQEKRTALISRAVTKGLDADARMKDSGVEWIEGIPAHWEVIKTKYLFRLSAEKVSAGSEAELLSLYTEIGVRPRKDLEPKGNKATTSEGYWVVRRGDIIVNKLLAWMGAIGYSNYDGITSPAYDILRKTKPLNSKYYHFLFRCGLYKPEFRRRSRGIMDMRLRLYFDEFGQIASLSPPISEQHEITAHLDNLDSRFDSLIENIQTAIGKLQEYRTALISAAVTGKIDVRETV